MRGAGGGPNMLVRYPDGIRSEFFYQKHAPAARPSWIDVVVLRFPSGCSAHDLDHSDELRVDLAPNVS